MEIIEVASGREKAVTVKNIDDDFRTLHKKRYFFNWKQFKQPTQLYKLQIVGEMDILGLMYLLDVPGGKRVEIKLLACSIENTGKNKVYDGIAGCLMAHACRIAKMKYNDLACVSLLPKTSLKAHYIDKYNMVDAGWQLYLEGRALNEIILKYLA